MESSTPLHTPALGRLTGTVVAPAHLTEDQRDAMVSLLSAYFENVNRAQFDHDLAEKEWVVLLIDAATGYIAGFSTLMRMQVSVDGQRVVAFYSGDTIIDRDYWGEAELPRIWGRHVFTLADQIRLEHGMDGPTDHTRVFWFLISSGYKTYRFLTVFFRDFFPTYRQPTPPDLLRIRDALALSKFPDEYDPAAGIIRFAHASPLREGVAEVSPQRLKDPDIAFFVQANPGYVNGEQLVCLVELRRDNLTAAGRRMLGEE